MNDSKSQTPVSAALASKPKRGKFLQFWRCFWLGFLVVSLGYAWYCFYVPSNKIAWADNATSAQQKAAQSDKPIILFFTAKWCVPCRIMKRSVWADKQVKAAVNARFIPVMIDMDDPDAAAATSRYSVRGTPTTIFTDQKGTALHRVEGGIGKADFLELLGKLNPSGDPLAR